MRISASPATHTRHFTSHPTTRPTSIRNRFDLWLSRIFSRLHYSFPFSAFFPFLKTVFKTFLDIFFFRDDTVILLFNNLLSPPFDTANLKKLVFYTDRYDTTCMTNL
jgi:hypothetical protein